MKLIFRLANPTHGHIKLGNINATSFNIDDWQRHIAIVPQDNVLFNRSLYENIHYGDKESSLDDIWEVIRDSKLEHLY